MRKTALESIKKYGMLNTGDKVVAAVSGGPDSMALLFFLNSIKEQFGIEVYALHVNHTIRGAESVRDQLFVVDYCRRNNIEILSVDKNVPEFSKNNKMSVEEAGRLMRHDAYKEALALFSANNCGKIALGHNKNDNAETFLLMLARGAGAKGLAGIAAKNEIKGIDIIRPLINCERWQIEEYCKENAIPFVTDSSNNSQIYSRNKIRLSIIPWFENNMDCDIVKAIANASEIIREQSEYMEAAAKTAFDECVDAKPEKGRLELWLDIEKLNKNHDSIKKMVIREAISRAGDDFGLKDITSSHISAVMSVLNKGTGKRAALPRGMYCETRYGKAIIGNANDDIKKNADNDNFCLNLAVGDIAYVAQKGVYISFSKQLIPEKTTENKQCYVCTEQKKGVLTDNLKNLCTKTIKCDKILSEVCIRTRKPGDRIKLRGGTKKLKDYFIDNKIPREERASAIIIADGYNVLSVLGYCDSVYAESGSETFFIQIWEDLDGRNTNAHIGGGA